MNTLATTGTTFDFRDPQRERTGFCIGGENRTWDSLIDTNGIQVLVKHTNTNSVFEAKDKNQTLDKGVSAVNIVLLSLTISIVFATFGTLGFFLFLSKGVVYVIHPIASLIIAIAGFFLFTSNVLAIRAAEND